jgi:hypothetical protein
MSVFIRDVCLRLRPLIESFLSFGGIFVLIVSLFREFYGYGLVTFLLMSLGFQFKSLSFFR